MSTSMSMSLRKTDGCVTKTREGEFKRRRENFEGVLNCDDQETCCGDLNGEEEIEWLEIDKVDVRKQEIQRAIKDLKNGKAVGSDKIAPEMIWSRGHVGNTNKTLQQQCMEIGAIVFFNKQR